VEYRKQGKLRGLLRRIGNGIVQDVPQELYACEICRKTQCDQDEWIVCENRIAHAKCLEALQASGPDPHKDRRPREGGDPEKSGRN
jgi:hypothetical protein